MTTTSGKAWREAREQGVEFTFPSGNVAAVRPIEADFFIRVGRVPSALMPVVAEYINGKTVVMDASARDLLDQSEEWLTFLDEVVRYGFVSPKVVDAPQNDDEIAVEDVSYFDKMFLYRYIFGRPAAVLRRFRDKIIPLAPVVPQPDLPPASEPDAADQPLGDPDRGAAGPVDGFAA